MESPELLVSRIEEAVRIIKEAHPERTQEDVLDQLVFFLHNFSAHPDAGQTLS
jgi:hypothetical protein